jgi:RNA polymerase sigma-70 factor (ECF subfamily)
MNFLASGPGESLADDWFQRFLAGDERAVGKVFELHYRGLLFFAGQIVRQDEAEDNVLIAIEKAWELRALIQSTLHLRRFLYLVVRRACIDDLRHRKRETEIFKELLKIAETAEAGQSAMEFEALWTRLLERVTQRVGELKPVEQDILRLYFFDQKSLQEIAEQLSIDVNKLYVDKSRLLKRLRGEFGEDWLSLLFLYFLKDLF